MVPKLLFVDCCIREYYCYNLQTTFAQYDTDRSGTMEGHELQRAITAFGMGWHYIEGHLQSFDAVGYNLSPQAIGCVLRRYSTDGKISFDDFVSCVTKLRSMTSEYCNNEC